MKHERKWKQIGKKGKIFNIFKEKHKIEDLSSNGIRLSIINDARALRIHLNVLESLKGVRRASVIRNRTEKCNQSKNVNRRSLSKNELLENKCEISTKAYSANFESNLGPSVKYDQTKSETLDGKLLFDLFNNNELLHNVYSNFNVIGDYEQSKINDYDFDFNCSEFHII